MKAKKTAHRVPSKVSRGDLEKALRQQQRVIQGLGKTVKEQAALKRPMEQIASACHEVIRAYCEATGDDSQSSWDESPAWQKESVLAGVENHISAPNMTPQESHEQWLKYKLAEGWTYGAAKDIENRKHPNLKPWAALSPSDKIKDALFVAVVAQFKLDEVDVAKCVIDNEVLGSALRMAQEELATYKNPNPKAASVPNDVSHSSLRHHDSAAGLMAEFNSGN